jgi:hypothetical protein
MLQIQILEDLQCEPVDLTEAKEFMHIDYFDYDDQIKRMIKSARQSSERVSGKAYGMKKIKISGNTYTDSSGEIVKIYPITPVMEASEDESNEEYTYLAGYDVCPEDLKQAILMRVATTFASRQDNGDGNKSVNASIIIERQYVSQLGA